MRILAIVAMRNEQHYVATCLDYLIEQGISVVVIDNDSTDASAAIARERLSKGVVMVDHYPYPGYYDWQGILTRKEEIRRQIPCDWCIHHDIDEIMESHRRKESLREAICRIDAMGYNAINFDEFVFLPEDDQVNYEGRNYYREMKRYYFFNPKPLRLVRGFQNRSNFSNVASGGHVVSGDELNIYPENFVLRHYISLSAEHARQKYLSRVYSSRELERGWHRSRANIDDESLVLPPRSQLLRYPYRPWQRFDKRSPRQTHFWEWEGCGRRAERPHLNRTDDSC